MHTQLPLTALFAVLATATSTPNLHPKPYHSTGRITTRSTEVTANQILAICPKSATCNNAPAAGECATAAAAAPFISDAFITYGIDSAAEQAALISLMAFETGDFKYNRNHYPGVPGQGTRNMQSPIFNEKYASSISEFSPAYASAKGNVTAVLDLLLSDGKYDFGSAAWFLTTQCSQAVRAELQSGSLSGWQGYISECVGTSVTDDRKGYWDKAVKALGV
ncbi:conserved hypothetical protein [Talaromyces stipitatus ATCC 10500]|uniref:Uncharacterized protein n=1 Tax=Talaromyces stipitatus (strain ATCC 10500 / CBS 375.48 / QM 6759 / NRRL 1006) TaxID=441959 RepID=B8MS44_TALSN|nr:uncharacterized protein TSTA_004890 [Talaromyces stipitatus ATCC 10500]EED12449.1 conserved hypothetical protein [Talaromyces stipitatus ATCC 10500]